MRQRINHWLRVVPIRVVWGLGLLPLSVLFWDVVNGSVGVDPVKAVEHRLGRTALYFLVGGLVATPALRLMRINAVRLRRPLGLLAFTYAALHVVAWVILDMGLMWSQILVDVIKRPYLAFGGAAFVALLALAVTSNDVSIRKWGRDWRRLHGFVYVAVPLVVLHWQWSLKTWALAPMIWGIAVVLLLFLRLMPRRCAPRVARVK